MKLNNYNGRWDWGVFWLHGIIGFIVGFLLAFLVNAFKSMMSLHWWENLITICSIVGVIFFLLGGFFGDKFWNKLKEYFP
ncbi:MAG: hypothetical protein A2W27_02755 [Deltaproteobacteria bacterium RBG_16_44_11]|nr:MAG: hypothetical protein A2W27_02755 [Deltaproteobacteria bacterium RBG_16_44_11]